MASRYSTSLGIEGEYEPGSRGRVLKNLLGVKSKREMDEIESKSLRQCEEQYVSTLTTATVFTVELIFEIHRQVFGSIYPWAGSLRSVNVSKAGFVWPPPQHLSSALKELDKKLRKFTPLVANDNVARTLAEVHADFLMIHPFRDGNGRIARVVANLMAFQAGRRLDYGFTGKGSRKRRTQYLLAVQQGYVENYDLLERFFEEALASTRLGSSAAGFFRPVAPSNTLDSYESISRISFLSEGSLR